MSKKKLPATSLEAYASLDPNKIRLMYKKILAALGELGLATYEEIASKMGEKPERIWKRLSDMAKLNLIHRPGEKRLMSSNRYGFVWKVGPGKDVTKQKKRVMKGPSVADFSKAILNQPKISPNIQAQLF